MLPYFPRTVPLRSQLSMPLSGPCTLIGNQMRVPPLRSHRFASLTFLHQSWAGMLDPWLANMDKGQACPTSTNQGKIPAPCPQDKGCSKHIMVFCVNPLPSPYPFCKNNLADPLPSAAGGYQARQGGKRIVFLPLLAHCEAFLPYSAPFNTM